MQDSIYTQLRKNGLKAIDAFTQAQNRIAAGEKWYNVKSTRANIEYNPASDDGLQWVENGSAGLRFVGYADEIATRNYNYACGIDHKGWYTMDDGANGETLRGVVYQLPARKGKPQYIAGYADPINEDCARLDFTSIYEGEKGGASEGVSYDSAARDAAKRSDRIAEISAEKEREYNDAFMHGSDYNQAGVDLKSKRKETIALIRDIKNERARGASETICNALRSVINSYLQQIADLKKTRADLWEEYEHLREPHNHWRQHLWIAFCDGADLNSAINS
jgi:hypothetical protein